jgi:Leucine-rich repeat (LRR) protein
MSHLLLNLLMLLVYQLLLISVEVLGTRRIVSGSCLGFTQCLCSTSSSAPAAQAEEEMSNVYPSVSCQNGSFSSVPWFFDPQLKSLYLPFNALSSFSLSKGLYPSLSILDVSHNHITSLDFSYCPRLRSINLSWNDLEELTGPALLGLPLLTHLNLAHNALARVHLTAFIHVPRLISLDLSNNFLSGKNRLGYLLELIVF